MFSRQKVTSEFLNAVRTIPFGECSGGGFDHKWIDRDRVSRGYSHGFWEHFV